MFDYLENLRMRPGHVRRNIAAGTAAGITALVAVGWIAVATTSGTFAIVEKSPTLAADASGVNSALAQTKDGFSSLLGAASEGFASASSGGQSGGAGAGIVIETHASTTVAQAQPTSLSF